jgi:hypothetical protein
MAIAALSSAMKQSGVNRKWWTVRVKGSSADRSMALASLHVEAATEGVADGPEAEGATVEVPSVLDARAAL